MNNNIISNNFNELWFNSIKQIYTNPDFICEPRNKKIKENLCFSMILTNPRQRYLTIPERKLSVIYGIVEFLWYYQGRDDLEMLSFYNKNISQFSDDNKTLNSHYGARIFGKKTININQWEIAKNKLLSDKDSRQAIIHINVPEDQSLNTKDVTCTMFFHFFIRENKLHMIANMRSQDAYWGLCYDLFSFTLFQELMLEQLKIKYDNLELGNYIHQDSSLHIYDTHFKMTEVILRKYDKTSINNLVNYVNMSFCEEDIQLLCELENKIRVGKSLDETIEPYLESEFGRWCYDNFKKFYYKKIIK